MNWPFPSSPGPLFQNEGRCSAFNMEIIFHSLANETHFHKKSCAPSLILKVGVFGTRKWPIVFNNWRTLTLRTPRYNGHPDNTDSSKIPGKNKLQTFDWNKLPQRVDCISPMSGNMNTYAVWMGNFYCSHPLTSDQDRKWPKVQNS